MGISTARSNAKSRPDQSCGMILLRYCCRIGAEGCITPGLSGEQGSLGGSVLVFSAHFSPLLLGYATDCSSIPQEVRVC